MDVTPFIRRAFPFLIPGIFFGSLFPDSSPVPPLFLSVTAIAAISVWPGKRSVHVLLACLAFSAGFLLSASEETAWDTSRPSGSVSGTATVVRNPERTDSERRAVVRFGSCLPDGICPDALVLASFSRYEDLSYGDIGTLSCDLKPFEEEWRMYYAKDRIAYRCRARSWETTGSAYPVRRAIFSVSERFESALTRALTEPEAGLASGLLLGGDRRLAPEIVDDFRAAGLSHIVAVSGYNISIVAEGFLLFGVFFFLSRLRASALSLSATAVFVIVSGAPASAIRAFGMASAMIVAGWLGRRYASYRAVVIVAAIMLLSNPLLLRHDIGFLLSFSAAIGITLSSSWAGRLTERLRFGGFFVESAVTTFSANLFVLPIILANFGSFPPTALLANAVLLPLVPYAMLFSFLAGVAGTIFPTFGSLFSFPSYAFLRPIVSGAEAAAGVASATTVHLPFGWAASLSWYAALFSVYAAASLATRYRGGYPEGKRSFGGFLSFSIAEAKRRIPGYSDHRDTGCR